MASLHDRVFLVAVALSSIVLIEPAPSDALFLLAFGGYLTLGRSVRGAQLFVVAATVYIFANVAASIVSSSALGADKFVYLVRMIVTRAYILAIAIAAIWYASGATRDKLDGLVKAFLFAALLCAVISIAAKFRAVPGYEMFYRDHAMIRLRGTFKDPNVMGPFLATAVMFLIYLWLTSKRGVFVMLSSGLVLFGAIVLSGSRGALLTLGCSGAVLLGLLVWDRRLVRNPFALLAGVSSALALALASSVALAYFGGTLDRLAARAAAQAYDVDRFATQRETFARAFAEPWGHGIASSVHRFSGFSVNDPHNLYAKIAYEAGILGLIALVAMLILTLAVPLHVTLNRTEDRSKRIFCAVLFATLVGHYVNSWFIDTTHWRHLFLLMGLAVGAPLYGWFSSPARAERPGLGSMSPSSSAQLG